MPHPFLPKMKSGAENTFPTPPAIGVWDERPRMHLEMLAGSLVIPPSEHRIHSLPDPWARALLFDRALYDSSHPLHRVVRGEWRGMLALLGLRERRGFDGLSASQLVVPDRDAAGSFSGVMAQLRPTTDLISADTGWDGLYIFRWQRRPFEQNRPRAFAFTSPTTLVCTGADYESILGPDEVPWFNRGADNSERRRLLHDPGEHLGRRERRALAEWLLMVSSGLLAFGDSSPRKNRVIGALGDFARELDATAAVPVDGDPWGLSTLGLQQGIYRPLDRSRKGEGETVSDVEIVTSKRNAPRRLLIEPTLAEQWNVGAQEITLYRDVTLDTPERLTSRADRTVEPGLQWCTAQSFFADRLIYDPNPTAAFPGCLPVRFTGTPQARSVVLPLKPELLDLFTAHELAERVSVEWLPNGGAVCHLQLQLRSGSAAPRNCRLQRTYTEAEMTSIANLPLIGIWPNFRLDGVRWKTYYTFQFWGGTKDELAIEPWADAEPTPAAHRKYASDPNRRFQVYRANAHPEALVCRTPYFDTTMQREAVATGLLLLQLPPVTQPSPSYDLVLGVDFGSTGTNVFMRSSGSEPKPIVFDGRVRQITDFDKGKFYDTCRDLFIPAKEWTAESILSVFQDFGDPPEGDVDRVVLRDGHVLYADDPSKFIVGDRRRVISNLKWGTERERVAARDFLMQVCLQAAAEVAFQGASSVDIRFSYPTAFSQRDLGLFGAHWLWVSNKVSELTGVAFRLDNRVDNREAITATRFFADRYAGNNEQMDVVGGALTMDIGGGTTDLAIWNRLELLTHSSVILAGRDIFLAAVARRPEILNEIHPQVPLDSLKRRERDGAFAAELDATVARYGAAMIEALAVRQARPSVQGLLGIIEVGLCGLAFYGGLLLRRLAEGGSFGDRRRIAIFVGGNGSKLFRWCALGSPIAGSTIHDVAAAAFRAGAALPDLEVEIHLSARPKSEVAYGLVSDPLPLTIAASASLPLAGEVFTVGGVEQSWNQGPDADDIRAKRVKVQPAMPIFSQFLTAIGRSRSADVDRLASHVDLRFALQAQDIERAEREDRSRPGAEVIRNEPIFVMALKRYLELEIDAWERRK
jgi:hypothetical protein